MVLDDENNIVTVYMTVSSTVTDKNTCNTVSTELKYKTRWNCFNIRKVRITLVTSRDGILIGVCLDVFHSLR
jgi:hypothetical protein